MGTRTECNVEQKKTFVQKIMELREKYADVLADPDWNGIEIPKAEPHEEIYDKKINVLWEKS